MKIDYDIEFLLSSLGHVTSLFYSLSPDNLIFYEMDI